MDELFLSVLNMSLSASLIIAFVTLIRLPLKKAPKVISYTLWIIVGFRLIFPFSIESVFSLASMRETQTTQNFGIQALSRIDSGIPSISINSLLMLNVIGAIIWLIGLSVMLIHSVFSVIVIRRQLADAVCIGENIYEAKGLKTPFVLGFFKPRIYIPPELKASDSRYVILHEQIHIRRHDHFVKLISYIILCIHWFNPIVWVAFRLMGNDLEMSCDERVLNEISGGQQINDEKKVEYSMSLLSIATGQRIVGSSTLTYDNGSVKERVQNLMISKKHSKTNIIIKICVILIMLLVLTVFFSFRITSASNNNNQVFIFGHSMLTVYEGGTEDIPVGSRIIVRTTDARDLKEGDDIAFYVAQGVVFTSRIINIWPDYYNTGTIGFQTNATINIDSESDIISEHNVIGRIIFHF